MLTEVFNSGISIVWIPLLEMLDYSSMYANIDFLKLES